MQSDSFDAIVVGGGLVGAAIAWGLRRQGLTTVLLDEGDVAYRASRGNFGLVWVQSKGLGAPWYQRWTRASAGIWPELAAELGARTGTDVGLQQPGGVHLCLSDNEMARPRRPHGADAGRGRQHRLRIPDDRGGRAARHAAGARAARSSVPPGRPMTATPTRCACCMRCIPPSSRRAAPMCRMPRSRMVTPRRTTSPSPPAAGASPRPASCWPPASAMPISRRASASPRRSARSAARCW